MILKSDDAIFILKIYLLLTIEKGGKDDFVLVSFAFQRGDRVLDRRVGTAWTRSQKMVEKQKRRL